MANIRVRNAMTKLPELLVLGRFSYRPDDIPLVSRRLSWPQKFNLIKSGIDALLTKSHPLSLPPVIQVEPTNICNLMCPLCPTGDGNMQRDRGVMSLQTFNRILGELGDTLITVILYGWGEPFLNKDLHRMIASCTVRNIRTSTSTNGHAIQTLEAALNLVDSGLTAITIAIDGSTQEIYGSYRKSGDIEQVKRCVSLIEQAKSLRKSIFPYTNIRLVVTRQNLQDIANVEKLAKNLRVNVFSYRSVACLSPNSTKSFQDYAPVGDPKCRYEYRGMSRISRSFFKCPYPFRQPTIFWDGTLVGCEFDYDLEAPWGNLAEKGFTHLWRSLQAFRLRQGIREGGRDLPSFCSRCPYQDRVQERCVLYAKQMRPFHD